MFKKIEIWILYLTILFSFPFAFSFGYLVRHEILGGTRFGKLSELALFLVEIPKTTKKLLFEENDLVLSDRFPNLDGFKGEPNISEKYLLLSRYDGDNKEGIIELVDLKSFKTLHTWNPDINSFNKLVNQEEVFKYLRRDSNNARLILKHPLLDNDGGLFFESDDAPFRKIDACSNLIFQNSEYQFHHSIEKDIDGNIWVPIHLYPQELPIDKVGREIIDEGGYRENGIAKLTPNGKILFQKSVQQIFIENGLEYLLFSVGDQHIFDRDPIHLNDIQPVNFDGEYWKKGDVFLSLRHQSMVLLYRPSTNKIIWKGTGPFFHQHDVNILDKNRISVFNNNSKGYIGGEEVVGNSEVIIYDFKTNKYSSYLRESLIENNLSTNTQGRSKILPNGDLFLEEQNFGRTLYLNSDGSLRWSHLNRAKDGKVYNIGWSRILYTKDDILNVNRFLQTKSKCYD